MAKRSNSENGRSKLDEAMTQLDQSVATLNLAVATLVQNQAAFAARVSETDRLHIELKRQSDERFARIEAQMAEIIRVLNEHSQILERLPDAVRERMGFRPQQ